MIPTEKGELSMLKRISVILVLVFLATAPAFTADLASLLRSVEAVPVSPSQATGNTATQPMKTTIRGTTYIVTTSLTDPTCDTGFGGYVDLEGFGIFPQSGIVGDGLAWSAFAAQDPYQHFGGSFVGLNFTDDGLVQFNSTDVAVPPQSLPDVTTPNDLIAALWADLEIVYDAGTNRGVSLATSGSDTTIIEFDDPVLAGTASIVGDFEFIIHSTINNAIGAPEIIIAFDNLGSLPATATIGAENADGTIAAPFLNAANPSAVLSDGLMICFDWDDVLPVELQSFSVE